MLAIITGGNTTFGDNESYNIEVELTSMPAYLQHHKNIQSITTNDINQSSKRFEPAEFEVKSEEPSAKEIGESLLNKCLMIYLVIKELTKLKIL